MGHEPNYTTASRSGCSHIVKFLRDALAFRHTAVSVGSPHALHAARGICFARLSQFQASGPRSQLSSVRFPVPPFLGVPEAHRTPATISSTSIVPTFIAGQPKALSTSLRPQTRTPVITAKRRARRVSGAGRRPSSIVSRKRRGMGSFEAAARETGLGSEKEKGPPRL